MRGPRNGFDSGFESPSVPPDDAPWSFQTTGSPTLDRIVKDYARPKAAETRQVTRGKKTITEIVRVAVNQEPCSEECAVQKHLVGKADPKQDWRKHALAARVAASGHPGPWSRDEVASFVRDAFVTKRRQERKMLFDRGQVLGFWEGDQLGSVPGDELPITHLPFVGK